jgi:Uma2 family endonuclease
MDFVLSGIELPVRITPAMPMSDEELMRFCAVNGDLRVEREPNGELLVMTPSNFNTSRINQRIGRILDEWAEADGRGVATDSNGGYTLRDGSMRAPDAAWVANRRWQKLSEKDQNRFAPICPDFVIEIRSPSDGLPELRAKMNAWIANGAEVAWLIDPIDKAVTVYRPGAEPEEHVNPSSVQGTGPIAGFELVLARVWG